jgi:hypothetical protein
MDEIYVKTDDDKEPYKDLVCDEFTQTRIFSFIFRNLKHT